MSSRRTLIKMSQVQERMNISRSKLYHIRKNDPNFPKSISFGRTFVWDAAEIDAYVSGLFEARDVA